MESYLKPGPWTLSRIIVSWVVPLLFIYLAISFFSLTPVISYIFAAAIIICGLIGIRSVYKFTLTPVGIIAGVLLIIVTYFHIGA